MAPRGRPRNPPGVPVKDRDILGVNMPFWAYTRGMSHFDRGRTLRAPWPLADPLDVPIFWYGADTITLQWVQYVFALDSDALTALAHQCRQGANFLIDQLAPVATPEQEGALTAAEQRALKGALTIAIRKLWIVVNRTEYIRATATP